MGGWGIPSQNKDQFDAFFTRGLRGVIRDGQREAIPFLIALAVTCLSPEEDTLVNFALLLLLNKPTATKPRNTMRLLTIAQDFPTSSKLNAGKTTSSTAINLE